MRHGKPALKDLYSWGAVNSSKMQEWVNCYNDSGVILDFPPDEDSVIKASECEKVVCSSLARSIHSAKLLGLTATMIDKVFVEADLPVFSIPFIKLTPQIWSVLFRFFWLLGFSKKLESKKEIKRRVTRASQLLIKLAERHDSVILIGHGIMNRLLVKELLKSGWQFVNTPNANKTFSHQYWGYKELQR